MLVRSRIDIITQILEVVNDGSGDGGDDGVTKTKIMYKAFLTYVQLKEYLPALTDNGLLRYDVDAQTFKTTQKGLRFLNTYNQIYDAIKIPPQQQVKMHEGGGL
jgi:predicted transcriptional regulator